MLLNHDNVIVLSSLSASATLPVLRLLLKLIQQNKACVVGSSHMAQSGIKRGATRQIGRWLVSQGREWLNSKLDPTKSQPLSPGEEAALQD